MCSATKNESKPRPSTSRAIAPGFPDCSVRNTNAPIFMDMFLAYDGGDLENDRQFQVLAINEIAMLQQHRSRRLDNDRIPLRVHLAKRRRHRTQLRRQGTDQR